VVVLEEVLLVVVLPDFLQLVEIPHGPMGHIQFTLLLPLVPLLLKYLEQKQKIFNM
tara:strand:+ start:66 stop:233 length:168 start_codon:yes stop_codon:yes gene_type:complete